MRLLQMPSILVGFRRPVAARKPVSCRGQTRSKSCQHLSGQHTYGTCTLAADAMCNRCEMKSQKEDRDDTIGKPACIGGIHRFNNIDATSKPVLFVRTVPTTEELKAVPEPLDRNKNLLYFNLRGTPGLIG